MRQLDDTAPGGYLDAAPTFEAVGGAGISAGQRDAALDLVKWLAMLTMLLDHLRYALPGVESLYVIGRFAFPLFCLGIAANVARSERGKLWTAANGRYLFWMGTFSLLSEFPYLLLVGQASTMNVMPTLLVGLIIAWGVHHPGMAARVTATLGVLFAAAFSQHLMYGVFGAMIPAAMVLALNRQGALGLLAGSFALFANANGVLFIDNFSIGGRALIAAAAFSSPIAGIWLLRRGVRSSIKPVTRWAYWFYPGHMAGLIALRALI